MYVDDIFTWGFRCQKQISRAWISNYTHSILWGVFTYARPRYTGRSSTPDVEGLPDLAYLPDLVIPDVDKTALSTRGTRCLSRPGAHTPHPMNWWMVGGTCHPINTRYEITAALLESSCATASSPVYLNWSAPTCPATPVGKSGHQLWTKLSWNPVNESIIPLVNFLKILLSCSNIITNIKGVFKISRLLKTSDNIAAAQFLQYVV